ncbi:baseplate J protein [Vibrio phage ST2-1pr]|uniref:baseplate J/gp47 family protein n=1 Tax=Vibrio sp. St2 TaxID=2853441 RepID=UPI001C775F44|nr:baseplate J/gp47 family protein [Vibrio sp. St2]QXM18743.1 baseplate J protein [Vibrio phage ST2-1pr]
MFDIQNDKLEQPEAFVMPAYDVQLAEFKSRIIEHLKVIKPELVEAVEQTLQNPFELGTIITEGAVKTLRDYIRSENYKSTQMLAYWSKGSNLDAKLADLGLKRQVIEAGDPNAYPPVDPVMESDEDALQRYMLAPFGLSTAGTNLGYRFHAMTLHERPKITVEKPEPNVVILRHEFPTEASTSKVKDVRLKARRNEVGDKNAKIDMWVLSRENDRGEASQGLQDEVKSYIAGRDDIIQETDELYVHSAEIVEYQHVVTLYATNTPMGTVDKDKVKESLQKYADSVHQLKGKVEESMVKFIGHGYYGVTKVVSNIPAEGVVCDIHQAPYCTNITVDVEYDSA